MFSSRRQPKLIRSMADETTDGACTPNLNSPSPDSFCSVEWWRFPRSFWIQIIRLAQRFSCHTRFDFDSEDLHGTRRSLPQSKHGACSVDAAISIEQLTITDVRLMLIVVVVKTFLFKSHTDSSVMNPIAPVAPREKMRSPHRGILFVLTSNRFVIKTPSSVNSRW